MTLILERLVPIQEIWLQFLADRTNGRAYSTVLRLSVVICNVCIVAKRCVLEQKLLLCLMTYTALNGLAPSYIADICRPVTYPSAVDIDSNPLLVATL